MRALIQRVSEASVTVEGSVVGAIGPGLLILLGVGQGDGPAEAHLLADKTAGLRIFSDAAGKFNHSVQEIGGSVLVVSQFTLYADTRKGRRPSFVRAAPPEIAQPLVDVYAEALRALGLTVAMGRFGAMMQVALVNDGPVTIMLEAPVAVS
ncbi:D-tyrosyl-tRNA(Tyr) deacylase [Candidatus Chloroploca sp. M-50]|uniref:D-aminoacyl-tRNA deacylase n=1 Tax=Candidatus Chloroploca mongolica TaxID=2528176 RepID=A0ABS4D986_9CHLR|nr:D-aminoacyl-tRNA deacylase [Candidatus Chloroploca mongolica]MBP1466007.1 D-tyrosyl-tRNA(Tyr) deacylase [Candidatus Chloroploca mongolica]